MNPPADWLLFLGRFHPLLVHFPIALIILLGLLEILARLPKFQHATIPVGPILLIAVPGSILTAVLGWLLSREGGYQANLLQWHFWTAIATACACTLTGILYWYECRKAYRVALFATILVLTVTSHYGGSLTHGSDYLVRYAPSGIRALLSPASTSRPSPAPAVTAAQTVIAPYPDAVQPMLDKHCVSCHGPEKSKGGLRLDTLAMMLKGGESGPALVSGKSSESLILQRIRLPIDHDDHMPPDGKPQLDDNDVALLQWWINAGSTPGPLTATPPPEIVQILNRRSGKPANLAPLPDPATLGNLAAILPTADRLAQELGIALAPLSESEAWLHCNAGIAGTGFGDDELARLAPIASHLRWLDLAGTKVTDAGLTHLQTMTNLTRLHLQRTPVTDAGVEKLKPLSQLTYLNLYDTAVTDKALPHLQKLPRLRHLYLWRTGVTSDAAQTFVNSRADNTQVQQWRDEIEKLQAQIRDHQFILELGSTTGPSSESPTPVNTVCPVSGKPVAVDKTLLYEKHLVAFCCDHCRAKFQQDPKPFLDALKLPTASNNSASKTPAPTAQMEARKP